MEQMQQTMFKNLSKSSVYNSQVKKITQKQRAFPFPKCTLLYQFCFIDRLQQIQNQFDLVDIHDKGKLTQQQIVGYLQQKYQSINMNILNQLFKTFKWQDSSVTKYYIQYLFYIENNSVKNIQKDKENCFIKLKDQIIINLGVELNNKSINKIYNMYQFIKIFQESQTICVFSNKYDLNLQQSQNGSVYGFISLILKSYYWHELQNLAAITYFQKKYIDQHDQPSFEVWLPSQQQTFFLKLVFTSPKNNNFVYGRSYVSQQIPSTIQKNQNITVDITLDNQKVGDCNITLKFQSSMQIVRNQLRKNKQLSIRYLQSLQSKVKQYEYLNFLWGMKYKSPQKISQLDVPWIMTVRTILLILVGLLGISCHIYGRCQPISLILSVLMIKTRDYVLMRIQKFSMTWLTLLGILLDIIWLVFASNHLSQINYVSLTMAKILTYCLLGVKGVLLLYLIIFQRSLDNSNNRSNDQM